MEALTHSLNGAMREAGIKKARKVRRVLTKVEIVEIKRALEKGAESQGEIAARYDVTPSTISRIKVEAGSKVDREGKHPMINFFRAKLDEMLADCKTLSDLRVAIDRFSEFLD